MDVNPDKMAANAASDAGCFGDIGRTMGRTGIQRVLLHLPCLDQGRQHL
ncbi:MAG: hypothetical protein F6K52_17050 [Moorea sp. SIO3H5]|nr:hypothetical protein [Moorena sp. SIO3H5]